MAQEPKRPIRTGNSMPKPQGNTRNNSWEGRSINESGKAVTTSAVLTPKRPGGNNN